MTELLDRAKKIKCVICDLDGVLTNGFIYMDDTGKELKTFNIQDGFGLKLLMISGIEVALITTSRNSLIENRMKQLGIKHFYTGQIDKQTAFNDLKQKLNLANENFAYIGDDLPDIPIIRQVGLGVAVNNAVSQVKEFAHWQTQASGGRGAVREVCDYILSAQNKMEGALESYLAIGVYS